MVSWEFFIPSLSNFFPVVDLNAYIELNESSEPTESNEQNEFRELDNIYFIFDDMFGELENVNAYDSGDFNYFSYDDDFYFENNSFNNEVYFSSEPTHPTYEKANDVQREFHQYVILDKFNSYFRKIYYSFLYGIKKNRNTDQNKKKQIQYFKEFKIHRSYVESKNITKKFRKSSHFNFTNQNKNRKIRHLKKAIIL